MTLYSPIVSIYCRTAAFFYWPQFCCSQHIVSWCFTLITATRSWMHLSNTHYSRVVLLGRNKISPHGPHVFHLNFSRPPVVFFLPVAASCKLILLCCFPAACLWVGLGEMKCSHWGEGTNRQWLQMEFGQWSEIPIQKIDRTLFTNWSLKFERGESHKCYIRSQRSFDF